MKTILIICGLVLRFCLHLINTCIFLLSCFFSSFVFTSLSLCFLFYLSFATVFVNCPASSFSLLPFAFLPSFFGPYIFLFTPWPGDHRTRGPEHDTTTGPEPQDQRTTGPEDHRTRGHSTTGSEDHRTRGPKDQRTTGPEDHRARGA